MKFSHQYIGLKEIEKQLKNLPLATQPKVMRSGLMGSLLPTLKAAREKAPIDRLRRNVMRSSNVKKSSGFQAEAGITMRTKGNKGDKRNAWFWHFFEFGTAPRHHKKSGKYVGQITPKPFLRPAWDATKMGIPERFAVTIRRAIEKAIKK